MRNQYECPTCETVIVTRNQIVEDHAPCGTFSDLLCATCYTPVIEIFYFDDTCDIDLMPQVKDMLLLGFNCETCNEPIPY